MRSAADDGAERQPLLAPPSGSGPDDGKPSRTPSTTNAQLVTEVLLLARRTAPASLGYALQNSIQTVSIAVVSAKSRSDLELSAASHGFMIAMVTAWTVALGGTTALDTLSSAAYSTAMAMQEATATATANHSDDPDPSHGVASAAEAKRRNHLRALHVVGILLQRSIFLLLLLFLPFALVWSTCSARLLVLLGQPRDVSLEIQRFLVWLLPGAPGYIVFECVKKFCQTQGDMAPPTLVLAAVVPFNLVANLLLVERFGLVGSPLAVSLTYWLMTLLLCLHLKSYRAHSTALAWGGWNLSQALRPSAMLGFATLAVPGICMVATEWIAFEIVALAAGNLGPRSLAAQSVIMTADQVLNTLPFGLGVAASSRIGNLIGVAMSTLSLSPSRGATRTSYGSTAAAAAAARSVHAVDDDDDDDDVEAHAKPTRPSTSSLAALRTSTHAAASLSVALGVAIGSALMAVRTSFGRLFSDNDDTVALVAHVLPYVAAFQISDGLAASCGGVLRGAGRQHVGAAANVVSYYVIALPLGIWLAFRGGWGLEGLWMGQVLALSLVGFGELLAVTAFTNWEHEVFKAQRRSEDDDVEPASVSSGLLGDVGREHP